MLPPNNSTGFDARRATTDVQRAIHLSASVPRLKSIQSKKEALMSTYPAGTSSPASVGASDETTIQPVKVSKSIVVFGYVSAILVPLVGFIVGGALYLKHRGAADNPGTGIVATAGIAWLLFFVFAIAASGSGGA
jgi:hypothetical protein